MREELTGEPLKTFETGARVTKPSAIIFDFAFQRIGTVCREDSRIGVVWDGSPNVFEYPPEYLFERAAES